MSAEIVTFSTPRHKRVRRLWVLMLCLLVVVVMGVVVNLFLLWPWMSGWGATKEEQEKPLPGDGLVPRAELQTTNALTVRARPEAIYPWLLQLGVDRGGMYSYDWLENLFGLNVHTVDRIMPEYQEVAVGDFWRFTPRDYVLNPGPGLYVRELQSSRALLLCFGLENKPEEACAMTWQFILEPQAEGTTRLLLRSRSSIEQTLPIKLTYFVQFIMNRKMLLGIAERAESLRSVIP